MGFNLPVSPNPGIMGDWEISRKGDVAGSVALPRCKNL